MTLENNNRYKTLGATLLVAGTCIGSGMIALPMVLAKIGLIPSIFFMFVIWFIMYYTSLVNLELNLNAKHGLTLGALGRLFSGKCAEFIGTVSLKILSFSLLAVFIYGGSSIVQELLISKFHITNTFTTVATYYALAAFAFLLLPIQWIDYVNRFLFIGLLAILAILLSGLAFSINWSELPLFGAQYTQISAWSSLIPIVFTSFGFQVIFHTLSNYCNLNARVLKQAFLWGSFIPALVYILWTCCILSVVYQNNFEFYQQMASGKTEVGELIQVLSSIAKWHSVQLLVWVISLLAITTSVLGVGVGLCDSLKGMLTNYIKTPYLKTIIAALITIFPAYLVVIYVPNAFIAVLGFAGMILAIIAVLLPVYLLKQLNVKHFHYPELNNAFLINFSVLVALAVIISELFNML